jgi:hypothetical protein
MGSENRDQWMNAIYASSSLFQLQLVDLKNTLDLLDYLGKHKYVSIIKKNVLESLYERNILISWFNLLHVVWVP